MPDKKIVMIRMEPGVHRELKSLAGIKGLTMGELIKQLIETEKLRLN